MNENLNGAFCEKKVIDYTSLIGNMKFNTTWLHRAIIIIDAGQGNLARKPLPESLNIFLGNQVIDK